MKRRAGFFGKKLLAFLFSVLVLSVAVFYMARLAPGDPLISYYGDRVERMSEAEREKAMDRFGLNAPIAVQYVRWLENALLGDFGLSFKYKQDVGAVILERLPGTLILGGLGFVLIFVLSLLLGLLCARFAGKPLDKLICRLGTVLSCIPEFWLSLVLILIFSVTLRLLPSSGAYTLGGSGGFWDRLRHMILPLCVVVMSHLWYYAYPVRRKLMEALRSDYVMLAKAKGLSRGRILWGHCIRNIMPAYLSLMVNSVPHVLWGTYIVEMVFSYPGIGTLAYESARYQDYHLLMLICMMTGALVMLCNMLSQMIGEGIDPRIRADEGIAQTEVRR